MIHAECILCFNSIKLNAGVPPSVKLIDVMRTDPLKRFTVNGDGNALRVTLNADDHRLNENKDCDEENKNDPNLTIPQTPNQIYFQQQHHQHQQLLLQQQHQHKQQHDGGRSILGGYTVNQMIGVQYPTQTSGPQYPTQTPGPQYPTQIPGLQYPTQTLPSLSLGPNMLGEEIPILENGHALAHTDSVNKRAHPNIISSPLGNISPTDHPFYLPSSNYRNNHNNDDDNNDNDLYNNNNNNNRMKKSVNNKFNMNMYINNNNININNSNISNNKNEYVQQHYNNEQHVRTDHQIQIQKFHLRNQSSSQQIQNLNKNMHKNISLDHTNEKHFFPNNNNNNKLERFNSFESFPLSRNFLISENNDNNGNINSNDFNYDNNINNNNDKICNRNNRRESESHCQGLRKSNSSLSHLSNPEFLISQNKGFGENSTSSLPLSISEFTGMEIFNSFDDSLKSRSSSTILENDKNSSSDSCNLSQKNIPSTNTSFLDVLNNDSSLDEFDHQSIELGGNSTSLLSYSDSMISYVDSNTKNSSYQPLSLAKECSTKLHRNSYTSDNIISKKINTDENEDFTKNKNFKCNQNYGQIQNCNQDYNNNLNLNNNHLNNNLLNKTDQKNNDNYYNNLKENQIENHDSNDDQKNNKYENQYEIKCENDIIIPPDKWMIKVWLPIAFEGFDTKLIDLFIVKLRDDGGFVTLQDLIDARTTQELTREALAEIAGFKLGHFNRLEKALSVFK